MTMEKTFAQISELFDQFSKDASLQVEKGNKAAGTRARKASLELEKLLKRFRKEYSKPRSNFYSGLDGMEMAA